MSTDPTSNVPRAKWSCCLVTGLGAMMVVALAVLGLRWSLRWQYERDSRDRWERQVADVKAGKTTDILWPEPRFLEEFVRDRPDVAAKITTVNFCMGTVSDERFGYVKDFPHLETIEFYEVRGADSFLKRIAGMESITALSFSETPLSEEGVRAVAGFPHLQRLHIDYFWKDTNLRPLSGHKSIEAISLDEVPITKEWISVLASLPKLREIELEVSKADLPNLRKALPNVKILPGK